MSDAGTAAGGAGAGVPEVPGTTPRPDITSSAAAAPTTAAPTAAAPAAAAPSAPATAADVAAADAVPPDAAPAATDAAPHVADEVADAAAADGEPTPPLRRIVEAILLVVDEPVPAVDLAQVVEQPRAAVEAVLAELAAEFREAGRGFELREVAGGWRLYTAADCAAYVERFVLDGQQARLTQAALETLAVIAYRQPVSRQAIAAIRGVNVDGVVRTLATRGLIAEAGQEGPGGAHLYVTTPYFLERLGLRSLAELPNLAPFLPVNLDDLADQA